MEQRIDNDKKAVDVIEAEFEKYWLENRKQILAADDAYSKAIGKYKITSGADWILWAIPIGVAMGVKDVIPIKNEMLNLLACIAVALLCYVLCVWIKTLMTGIPDLGLLESHVKEKTRQQWVRDRFPHKNK